MDRRIDIVEGAELVDPVLVAAWPGMGLVGLKTVHYLRDQFAPRLIAEIDCSDFITFSGVHVDKGIIERPKVPKSSFFAFRPDELDRDIVVFIGEEQATSGKEYALAQLVVEVARHFSVRQIITAAAMVTSIQHTHPSKVWVAATKQSLLDDVPDIPHVIVNDGNVGGLNGLLLGVAVEHDIDGYCFLGEIPYYVTNLENPKGAAVILEFISELLGFEIDLSSINEKALYVEDQIDKAVKQVKADVTKNLSEETEATESDTDETPPGAIN